MRLIARASFRRKQRLRVRVKDTKLLLQIYRSNNNDKNAKWIYIRK